jgi:hypothetical protein
VTLVWTTAVAIWLGLVTTLPSWSKHWRKSQNQ